MGKRGPQPTPTATLRLRGSWRAKTRPGEPDALPGDPECPVKLTGAQRKLWDKTIAIMRESSTLSRGDGAAIAAYVIALSKVDAASRVRDDVALLKWLDKLNRAAASLGLSPASRASVSKVTTTTTTNSKARFFGGA